MSPNRKQTEDNQAKKLLNMKWDHMGLNQTNYSATFDLINQKHAAKITTPSSVDNNKALVEGLSQMELYV